MTVDGEPADERRAIHDEFERAVHGLIESGLQKCRIVVATACVNVAVELRAGAAGVNDPVPGRSRWSRGFSASDETGGGQGRSHDQDAMCHAPPCRAADHRQKIWRFGSSGCNHLGLVRLS